MFQLFNLSNNDNHFYYFEDAKLQWYKSSEHFQLFKLFVNKILK